MPYLRDFLLGTVPAGHVAALDAGAHSAPRGREGRASSRHIPSVLCGSELHK